MVTRSRLMLLLLFLIFSGIWTSIYGQQLREAFRKIHQSVVIVRTKQVDLSSSSKAISIIDGLGSGVLISADGKILTAAHVVQTADVASVEFPDGQEVIARVIGTDVRSDVALLQLKQIPGGIAPATLGDSNKLEVGDEIFVVGAPYGISQTLTAGHLSGRHWLNKNDESAAAVEFLQTDAAVNGGSSGSPVFNLNGEVVGIISSLMSRSGGSEGLAFATASNTARYFLLDRQPFWFGIDGLLVTGNLAKALNLPQPTGFLVQRVGDGSIGSSLRLNPGTLRATVQGTDILLGGDVILSVNEIQVTSASTVDQAGEVASDDSYERIYKNIGTLKRGDNLVVKVLREGRVVTLSAPVER
ncbi:MAG TPA: trypsin-like peptidase domain-containing protein [Pyrinomonadaceae bacterium]|nr:trypsin-like peptidase domain-containing protein [Pyrinomonadaceae bacterium]